MKDECEFGKSHGIKQIPIVIDPIIELDYFNLKYRRIEYIPVPPFMDAGPAQMAIARELGRIMGLRMAGSEGGLEFELKHKKL